MQILCPGGLFFFGDWLESPTLQPGHPYSYDIGAYIPGTVSFYNAVSCVAIIIPSFSLLPYSYMMSGIVG
jgi:hypothetical protein